MPKDAKQNKKEIIIFETPYPLHFEKKRDPTFLFKLHSEKTKENKK